ncbi:GntR family transcriptional regulator [Lentibacillus amyloliquefaciens]|uniref:HTH gntR-type domain-containing protein n=1 Tax=Lentibacillus amyloliquefaciens TaxID=1472767 RepID=A0A0U4FAP9_9BACI|nr:GntR family transcriptional regulator [Lentibacillus amyloliquefaciens]ALX47565.1 hypothetical protein AOX59_02470 [Lentibacillus amyloliquefaciens]
MSVKQIIRRNDNGEHIPMYIRIAMDLREMILKGEYKQEEKIATEDEIALEYGVSRMTARGAITELVREGLVYRVHGKGTFVSRDKIERNLNRVTGFHEDMISMGLKPSSKVIKFKKRLPTDYECYELKLQKSTTVFEINRIRYIDDKPYGYQELILPEYLLKDLSKEDLEKKSLYAYLESINYPISYANQRMEVSTDTNINKIIDIPTHIPFFYINRISYLENDVPVELFNSYFRGDKFSYSLRLSNHNE